MIRKTDEISVAAQYCILGLDGMDFLATSNEDDLTIRQAMFEKARKLQREQEEQQAQRIANEVGKVISKMFSR